MHRSHQGQYLDRFRFRKLLGENPFLQEISSGQKQHPQPVTFESSAQHRGHEQKVWANQQAAAVVALQREQVLSNQ